MLVWEGDGVVCWCEMRRERERRGDGGRRGVEDSMCLNLDCDHVDGLYLSIFRSTSQRVGTGY